MEIKSKIRPEIIQAAVAVLSSAIPSLSPDALVAALREYKGTDGGTAKPQKPLTRQEVAELLGMSLQTINRMLNDGRLRRIKVGLRAVRIDPASVRAILEGDAVSQEMEAER